MPRKVLLMGRSGSGKTSMRSVIFHNQVAAETRRLGATINAEAKEVTFLADMKLDLWDCGGQESFMDNYLTSQKEHIFRGVHTLIYIFDVESPQFNTTDMHYFVDCLAALKTNFGTAGSDDRGAATRDGGVVANALVHVLIHKMDLIPLENREDAFANRTALIKRKCKDAGFDSVDTFGTSIWDESLYRAWSHIVSTFIPNATALRAQLRKFADVCNATEVILFEGRTFLLICQNTATGKDDLQIWEAGRFEKITQVIKVFRLNCRRLLRNDFSSMQVTTSSYTAVLDSLTPNTFIMVICTESGVQPAGIMLNINLSRPHFAKLQVWSQDRPETRS